VRGGGVLVQVGLLNSGVFRVTQQCLLGLSPIFFILKFTSYPYIHLQTKHHLIRQFELIESNTKSYRFLVLAPYVTQIYINYRGFIHRDAFTGANNGSAARKYR
jgi:hypothetical protein